MDHWVGIVIGVVSAIVIAGIVYAAINGYVLDQISQF